MVACNSREMFWLFFYLAEIRYPSSLVLSKEELIEMITEIIKWFIQ